MTIVKGQIESLKQVQAELRQRGITRFNSIGDIKAFQKDYALEREKIVLQVEQDVELQIEAFKIDKIHLQKAYEILVSKETIRLKGEIDNLSNKHDLLMSKDSTFFIKALNSFRIILLDLRKTRLEKNFHEIVLKNTSELAQKLEKTTQELNNYTDNRQEIIFNRSSPKIKDLEYTKEVVDDLYPLIAGAAGESMVVDELKKLSDKYILFNDFSIAFDKPIYNRKEKDRIYSIQIDHLLVTNSGVFILETKNWSKEAIKNYDLRSPVQQIQRTSYALFALLNNRSKQSSLKLNKHHWGDKKIPIRNLIVMIHHKPKLEFNFVKVLTLTEVNRYITFFDPIFDDSEVNSISSYLEKMKSENHISAKTHQPFTDKGKSRQGIYETLSKPNLQDWLMRNPDKGVNDYYSEFG